MLDLRDPGAADAVARDVVSDPQTFTDTLPKLLLRNAAEHPNAVAMREKDRGVWRETTWSAYADEVARCAAGLAGLGVRPGQAVIVMGDNRVRLYAAMVAVGMLRAYAMPAYPSATIEELEHFVGQADVAAAVAEDQEQVDKLLELRERTGVTAAIVYDDPRGVKEYRDPGILSWSDLVASGAERLLSEPDLRDRMAARVGRDDPAVFMHSSGTTGKPKGIVLSQGNVTAAARNAHAGGVLGYGEEVIAYLPLAWVGDFAITVAAAICFRFTVNVPERQETVLRDMREVPPTFYLAAPRSWDNLLTTIQVGMENSTRLKRRVFRFFLDRAVEEERRKLEGKGGGVLQAFTRQLGDVLVFAPIRDQFGLTRLRHAFTGGEAIGEDTFVFYRALGIKLRQFYGQTENSAFTAAQGEDEVKLHTVGRALPGVAVRLSDDGEIQLCADSVFQGYYGDEVATSRVLREGWLSTGDAGYLEDGGHIVVLGRSAEVVKTAAGERYVPNYIENRVKFSPYVKDAAVVGAGRSELTAIVCIDGEAVGHWAEVNAVPYTSYADLSQKPEVAELVREALARVNAVMKRELHVKRFVSLHKEFDPDDGEITRTRKLRRSTVEERYAAVIEALYDGSTLR